MIDQTDKKTWQEPEIVIMDISGGIPPGTGETFLNGIPLGS